MNWLKRIIVKWVREDWDNEGNKKSNDVWALGSTQIKVRPSSPSDHDYAETIRFELSPAIGGRILTVRRYDRRNDSNDTQVYVIAQGEDVGQRVTKILNLELIK